MPEPTAHRPGVFSGLAALVKYLADSRGGIAVMTAIGTPVVVAVLGIAVDYVSYSGRLSALQVAADAAAIAAAKELSVASSSSSSIAASAKSYAESAVEHDGATIATDVKIDRVQSKVTVRLSEEWKPFFGHFVGLAVTPVVVRATAVLQGSQNICVVALDPSVNKALHLDKSARLVANGCGVYSNSTHSSGIRLDADSEIAATLICSAGGVNARSSAVDPGPLTDCPPVPDPLAGRIEPVVGGCDFTGLEIKTGNEVLGAGVYCAGLRVSGDAVVTFKEGDYIIKDGAFRISDEAKVTGNHVSFYLTGKETVLEFDDQAMVSLTGARSGAMAGLLFFEDRAAPLNNTHRIRSDGVGNLTGTIYLSRGLLRIDPNASVAQDSAFTAIIVNRMELDEGPKLVINSDYGATDVPVPEGIRISASVSLSQ